MENNENGTLDLTTLVKQGEQGVSILPPELLAASLFNTKNKLNSIEVQLPVLNEKIICNNIESLDEVTVKTISGSLQMYIDENIELFWNSITFPETSWVKTIEDFKQLSEADYNTAVYGVMRASFKTLNQSTFICGNQKCSNTDPERKFKFTPTMNMINIDYPQGIFKSPNNDFRRDTFISEIGNLTITYKFDCIGDKLELFRNKSNEEIRQNIRTIRSLISKLETTPIFIDSITITDPSLEQPIVLKNKNEIMIFIHKLNTTSKELVEESNNRFIDYILGFKPTFSAKIPCPHCNQMTDWKDIDLMVEFFLKVSTIY